MSVSPPNGPFSRHADYPLTLEEGAKGEVESHTQENSKATAEEILSAISPLELDLDLNLPPLRLERQTGYQHFAIEHRIGNTTQNVPNVSQNSKERAEENAKEYFAASPSSLR